MITLQMIWVCILCRKKQELLIKTGTWMHSTAEMSSDPILRRIEQDMAIATTPTSASAGQFMPGGVPYHQHHHPHHLSGGKSPQNQPTSPAASSISSFFSKAMSIASTPPTNYPSTRPRPPFGVYPSTGPAPSLPSNGRSGGGRAVGLTRQRSLESSDSGPSPCGGYPSTFAAPGGGRAPSRLGMAPPPLTRQARSAEIEDECASILSGGEATPTASIPYSPSASYNQQRFRPRFRGDPLGPSPSPRPYLSRGKSLGESPTFPSLPPSFSFHNRPITSNVATPMSVRSMTNSITASIGSITGSLSMGSHNPPPPPAPTKGSVSRLNMEVMSAPEDTYHDATPSSLYPRVLVSDSEARDICPPLSDRGPPGLHPDTSRLMDPRVMRTSTSRRKLDSTFRNDSLSSDQSECLQQNRPPPPKPHKHKRSHGHGHHSHGGSRGSGRPFGVSSSDEEIRSTPECTSCGEEEMESESVSEKGRLTVDYSYSAPIIDNLF